MIWRILCFLFLCNISWAQQASDSKVFTIELYLDWVRKYHPVMQQANLLGEIGAATVLESRGLFDPKLYGDYEDKSFDKKNYFSVGEAGLKIPTWWGVDVKAAYTWANGVFLNPNNTLPQNGQAILAVEIPLAQGLLFDQRRAQVKQAGIYQEGTQLERRAVVNDLLVEAIEAYWNWAYQYRAVEVFRTSVKLAEDRFGLIRESFIQGDKPAVDTLESMIQVQNRSIDLAQAEVALGNARLLLSNFLWLEDQTPLELEVDQVPLNLEVLDVVDYQEFVSDFMQSLNQSHPDLLLIENKQQQLEIKERLKREALKPRINFDYNFLGNNLDFIPEDVNGNGGLNNLFTQNYKWGLNVSYPILTRKERGGLELVRLEQLDTRYKLQNKRQEIKNKINALLQQLQTNEEQLVLQREVRDNYQLLLEAENVKFRIGESSIFLLNSREQKLIETELKLAKLRANNQKLQRKLEWAMGLLN